jgi:hypothetical protein
MVLEHDEWKPGVITTVDTLMLSFQPDKWYTLRLELIGNLAPRQLDLLQWFMGSEIEEMGNR